MCEQLAHYRYEMTVNRTRYLFIESWLSTTSLLTYLLFNHENDNTRWWWRLISAILSPTWR